MTKREREMLDQVLRSLEEEANRADIHAELLYGENAPATAFARGRVASIAKVRVRLEELNLLKCLLSYRKEV